MTSLEFFPPVDHNPKVPTEWGSGKLKENINAWNRGQGEPTWHYKGKPVNQDYTLTQLKLSNIRSNDELIPRPQVMKMGEIMINKDFPAEHPYSSHMSRYAVFPTFQSPEDAKRGIQARREQPINAEMPATAFDVQIIHKTKGYGDRRELQYFPKESEKVGLEWKGEDGFHQLVKAHGGRQQYYPTPPKVVCPNLQDRAEKITERSANAMRNLERNHWQTTYDLNNTGLGPLNPMKLDNLDDKKRAMDVYGVEDNKLYPRSINTFDPPRPFEGRIARSIIPRPPPQKTNSDEDENTDYIPRKTLREREEHRLWNGTEYVNLPDTTEEQNQHMLALRWKEMNDTAHPDPNLGVVSQQMERQPSENIPCPPVVGVPPDTAENYLQTTKQRQDEIFQQVEAQNRFAVLELEKPSHVITTLNHKMQKVHETEKPRTFYGHEGKYNEERAGVYKTSYSPEVLAHSMNDLETSGPEIMNTMHSHEDAAYLPTQLSRDMKDAFRGVRTLSLSQPNLAGDRRETREVILPHNELKNVQKRILQPTVENARVKIQEGETILKESNMGDSYNTHKFLQDYKITQAGRNEPLNLMSVENSKLKNVRSAAELRNRNGMSKSVSFSDSVTVASSREDGKFRTFSAAMADGKETKADDKANTTQYLSTQAEYRKNNETSLRRPQPTFLMPDPPPVIKENPADTTEPMTSPRRPRRRPFSTTDTEYRDEFGSLSSNVAPTNLRHSYTFQTAYESQFPKYHHIGYKSDDRFNWEPGHGVPRPQSTLLQIQDSFSKTDIRRNFHSQFKENNPDLRMNIIQGKKHVFDGMDAQVLHG
ncbi:uncharacterized protein LOC134253941 [Saccostrea cucullata]|uniref:uncharacterized protein LOC134253941 n=1 Tax=Saccostrea cuccullata TaxID=36930 RepID=UPI002ED2F557